MSVTSLESHPRGDNNVHITETKQRPTLPLKIHRQIERLEKRIEKLTKENDTLKAKVDYFRNANTRIRKLPK
jgi:predicted RNase H-like nuclease (RuvC/YqgF family)